MNRDYFKLSAFDKRILKECPTMTYGASFIKYISWAPIVISFAAGFVVFPIFNVSYLLLNVLVASIFSIIHIRIIQAFDQALHKNKDWNTMSSIVFTTMLITLIQNFFISNFLFKAESDIYAFLHNLNSPKNWIYSTIYQFQKLFFIYSFNNNIVSFISIAIFIVILFIEILPFILTFYYRNSKYYTTQTIIENFKTEYERLINKKGA